jgi:hypothetical protein
MEAAGIIASGQSPALVDYTLVGEAVDSAYARLRKLGLAPFALADTPDWAQVPLRDYVAYDIAGVFGVGGEKLADITRRRADAERELGRQVAGYRHDVPIKARYY